MRRLAMDDFAIVSATILSIGQTVAVLSASAHGLGKHWGGLDHSHRRGFEKATYVSGLLFILTTILVKISIILFLRALAPIQDLKRTAKALGILICLWGVGSFLAAAFQCSVPMVWRLTGNTCFNIRCRCLRRSNGLHCPGSRRIRLDVRLMAPNNLYGDRTMCQSHNSVHTIPATVSVELGVRNSMG